MTETTALLSREQRVDWAVTPRVNLLPPEILDARRFRRMQKLLAAGVALVVALVAVITWWAQIGVDHARDQLATAQAKTTELQAEQARYAEVPRVLAQVAIAQGLRGTVLGSDILWNGYLSDIAQTTPPTVWLDSLSVSITGASPAAPTGQANPLGSPGIGTLTIEGHADNFPAVSAWLDSVVTVTGFTDATLSTSARDGQDTSAPIKFTATVTVTTDALSHRYDTKAG